MKVSIIGSGYVGTTLAGCLADFGHDVVNIDIDEEVVEAINTGDSPIHEPGLDELIEKYAGQRLRASTDYAEIQATELTFLALPTPSQDDGSIDPSYVEAAAEAVGEALAEKESRHLVVVKSTVTPSTTEEIVVPALERGLEGQLGEKTAVATNPEFLREGSAVSDFQDPDKLVFGYEVEWAGELLDELYEIQIDEEVPVVRTDLRTAMMIKYANNSFLAAKVSLVNDIGNICKEYGIDAYKVSEAIGLDDRISSQFLRSGLGWGGSCFPKDIAALIAAAEKEGYEPELLKSAVAVNEKQPARMLSMLESHVEVSESRIAVLGLSFKPGTDDVRNSRAIPIIDGLLEQGAEVVAYDPVATENMREYFPEVTYTSSPELALTGADGACIVTDWDEFETLDSAFDAMNEEVIIDGRRVVGRQEGMTYEGLTW